MSQYFLSTMQGLYTDASNKKSYLLIYAIKQALFNQDRQISNMLTHLCSVMSNERMERCFQKGAIQPFTSRAVRMSR